MKAAPYHWKRSPTYISMTYWTYLLIPCQEADAFHTVPSRHPAPRKHWETTGGLTLDSLNQNTHIIREANYFINDQYKGHCSETQRHQGNPQEPQSVWVGTPSQSLVFGPHLTSGSSHGLLHNNKGLFAQDSPLAVKCPVLTPNWIFYTNMLNPILHPSIHPPCNHSPWLDVHILPGFWWATALLR